MPSGQRSERRRAEIMGRQPPSGAGVSDVPDAAENTDDVTEHSAVTESEVRAIVQQEVSETYHGPLPHPVHLAAYEQTVPGCGREIVNAFLDQSKHRRELERAVVLGSERRATTGQWLVLFLMLVVIGGGLLVAFMVQAFAGAGIVTAGIGSGVWLYLSGGRPPEGPPAKDGSE